MVAQRRSELDDISELDGINQLSQPDLDALALGVTLLGCGGGGRVEQIVAQLRHVDDGPLATLVSADDRQLGLRHVMAVGFLGSTMVMDEKLPAGDELAGAVGAIEQWTGVTAEALMPSQIGGVCGLAVISVARQLSLPVIDADLEGRSVPRLDQFSIAVAGRTTVPFAITGPNGLKLVLDAADPPQVESVIRAAVTQTGGWSAFALGPVPFDELAGFAILGSMSRALALGRIMLTTTGGSPESIGAALGGRTLCVGRVIAVSRLADISSFVRASFAILDFRDGAVVRVEAGSEYLMVLTDGEPVVTCPDIISVLDARTHEPIDAGELGDGREIVVLTVPGPRWWTSTPERMAHVGPRAYGIDCDPIVAETA
ncbi:DUF917 domain-containing protein [Saxibacter everestensis]|uniref:DUF917 domain-containing protein n=1 Tax=Saxibacter everestensis TaxID=2909229 RepID=A0ABY8QTK7_9MICO|nr:DUF917 domain-containing protein [Brevibacteriaceae bacterium ZFBP1038]